MRVLGWAGTSLRALLILAAITTAAVVPAQADGRVALVIGNAEYGPDIGRLKNPTNDAKLIAETLTALGFTVELALDADQRTMKRAVKSFGAKLRDAGPNGIGLFYFAGHGVQVAGENFLIPVGAEIEAEGDVSIEAISAGDVLSQMQFAGNAVNLVFLDACRNNPLTRDFRATLRGLARVDAPRGSFVGYSTAPGEVAVDGDGANSPYALALADELKEPGEAVDTAHRNVRSRVLAATGNRQTPWDSSSLIGEVILAAKAPEPVAAPAVAPATPVAAASNEALFWESIKDSTNPAMFQAYLKKYPNGDFVDLAEAKLAELKLAATQTAALTPEPQVPATPMPAAPAPAAPTVAAPEIEEMDATYVAVSSANLRALPSTDAPVLLRLKTDDIVSVTGKVKGKDWYRARVGGESGYVSAKLLQTADADEAAAWLRLKKAPSTEAARSFITAYPQSMFRPRAEALLAKLQAPPAKATPDAAATNKTAVPVPAVPVPAVPAPSTGATDDQAAASAAPSPAAPVTPAPTAPQSTTPDPPSTPAGAVKVGQTYQLSLSVGAGTIHRGTLKVDSQDSPNVFTATGNLVSTGSAGQYAIRVTMTIDGDLMTIRGAAINGGASTINLKLTKSGKDKYVGTGMEFGYFARAILSLL